MITNIYQECRNLGIPTANYESDLHIPATPETRKLIQRYEFKQNVASFVSALDGKEWFNVPFAYTPWWDSKRKCPACGTNGNHYCPADVARD